VTGSQLALEVPHGPRTDLVSTVTILPTVVSAICVLLITVGVQNGRSVSLGAAIEATAFVFLVVLLVSAPVGFSRSCSLVGLDREGIRRYDLFRRTRLTAMLVEWAWLDPVPRGWIPLGFVTFRWHKPGGYTYWYQFTVSPMQARAILTHPSCPRKPIHSKLIRMLDLPPDWPVDSYRR
jgi:hypothetical protein